MKKDNIVLEKSFAFAVKVVRECNYLIKDKKEYVLAKQLLRSGTSVGANLEEAMGGQSKKDFYAKLTIAYKEARESKYWTRLLIESYPNEKKRLNSLLTYSDELLRIIGSIQLTMRKQMIK
jgi:four helix bundle protein